MSPAFWTNTIWYLLLGVITIIQMVIVLIKAQNRAHIISLFFFISGMTFSIEVIICCFLRAYDYYPMIIPHSPIDDNLAGNLFSQFSITTTALMVIVFNLKYYWFFIITGIYWVIEELFLKLGIYSHNWYQTWITSLGLPILFALWKRLSKSSILFTGQFWRYVSMFLGLYTLHMIIIWWTFLLLNILGINTNIFQDTLVSYAFISFLNLLILSIACMFIYFSPLKWWMRLIVIFMLYSIIYLARTMNIIYIKPGWLLIVATINIFGMLLFVFFLDKLFSKACKEIIH
jgi:hypothetical protein